MTRDEEIYKAATEYADDYGHFNCDLNTGRDDFMEGAMWADKHPSWDLIAKVWNIAVDITIAQINEEEKEFDSDKEVKDYIKEKLGL